MNITDEIKNFQVTTALPAELIKTSREYTTLAILKYSFPDCFSTLHKAESPDLQDDEGKLGIEVAWGGAPRNELITSEGLKYSRAKNEKAREKCLQIIRQNGGDRDEISITYPVGTAEDDKKHVQNIFRKKLKKVDNYRKAFKQVGLAIMIDIPLFYFTDSDWGQWLSDLNQGAFGFVAIIHWSGVDIYDFSSKKYFSKRIDRETMGDLSKLARMTAEGIIKDTDPAWK